MSAKPMEYQEIMWAEMSPDMYGGDNCDEVIPGWECYCDGDMDKEDGLPSLELAARTFPPGTKVIVSVPVCPKCGTQVELCKAEGECNFNWDDWVVGEYS